MHYWRRINCGHFSCSPLCATVSVLGAIVLLTGLVTVLVILSRSSQKQTTSTSKSETSHILNQHYIVFYSAIHNLEYVICQWDIQIKHIFCIANFTINNITIGTLSTSGTFSIDQFPPPTYPSHDEAYTADESILESIYHMIFLVLKCLKYLYCLSYLYAIFL